MLFVKIVAEAEVVAAGVVEEEVDPNFLQSSVAGAVVVEAVKIAVEAEVAVAGPVVVGSNCLR